MRDVCSLMFEIGRSRVITESSEIILLVGGCKCWETIYLGEEHEALWDCGKTNTAMQSRNKP